MNKTLKSLLAKGINSKVAEKIINSGYNLSTLSACSKEELEELGIDEFTRKQILDKRPPIPEDIIDNLLYKSMRTCCICRKSKRQIIIHHIIEWKVSRSNQEENLVVLCLKHHGEAHTYKELAQNLTADRIIAAKSKWENEVAEMSKKSAFKELEVITRQDYILREKWFNFLSKINMRIENIESSIEKFKFDFKIYGKSFLFLKVYDIEHIDDLINKENLIQNFKGAFF